MRSRKVIPLDAPPPSGIFVRTPSGHAYYVKDGRALSVSEIHLDSWRPHVIQITEMAFRTLEPGGKLGFRDGTLVKDFGDGRIYLISDSKRCHVTDPIAYEALGGRKWEITAPSEYLRVHPEGEEIGNPNA